MSDPTPAAQPPRRPPLSIGRRIGVAVAILVLLFSGGCSLFLLILGPGAVGYVLILGGIPLAVGAAILRSALYRPPGYTSPPPLTAGRRIVVIICVAVMVVTVLDLLWLPAKSFGLDYWPSPLASLFGGRHDFIFSEIFPIFAGVLFVAGFLMWWLAIRVGR